MDCRTALRIAALALGLGGLALGQVAAGDDGAESLLTNGGFELDSKGANWPDDWPHPAGARWEQEDGGHFLRLRPDAPGQTLVLYRAVRLRPGCQALELACRVRHADIKPGREAWHDARIVLHFKDDAGRERVPAPAPLVFRGDSKGWTQCRSRFLVPAKATLLEVMPAMFQVASGTLDLDDFILKPIAPSAVRDRAATTATRVEFQCPPPDPARLPKELRVAGRRLQTPDGTEVWLQGLNVESLEWTAVGEHVPESAAVALDQWKANVLRLPVKDDFWFGAGRGQKDGGKGYRRLMDEVVQAAASRGAYVVIDLHRFGAPTDDSLDFWREAAARYRNHPSVLFDLFNEPHDVSWEVWRNGGTVEDKGHRTAYESPGMQQLVDTIRQAGARNVIVAGGLAWAYDLSGVAKGHALDEKGGNGIMYSAHIYNWHRGWKENVLDAAEKFPVLVGEVGCDAKPMSFIPKEQQEDPYTWAPDVLGFIQKHRLNWTGWSFHPKSAPRLILDWDYTPTPFWGEFVKAALGGKRFEMGKMR